MDRENQNNFGYYSRRQFMRWAGLFSATAGFVGVAGAAATGISEVILRVTPDIASPYPSGGWLETSLPKRPDFVSMPDGHKEYLRYVCLNSPVVRHAFVNSFNYILNNQGQVPKMSDFFLYNVQNARNSLIETKGDKNPSWENCLHVASFAMAGVLSFYFTYGELQDMGVNLQVPDKFRNEILRPLRNEVGELRPDFMPPTYLPRVYPAELIECQKKITRAAICTGGDRSLHFANHFFLTLQYLYVKKIWIERCR